MPTVLGPAWNKSIGRTPPHMSKEDERIWDRWKDTHLTDNYILYFDVGLGDGIKPPAGIDANIAAGWIRDTQKRADLIVNTGRKWWIVEFRDNATANAVGRLLLYNELFKQDLPLQQPVELILVTNRNDPDLKKLSIIYNIDYHFV